MNEKANQPARDQETTELITSYLDGELTDEQRVAVENRLTRDVAFRSQMQQLQKTWDLLDTLPRPVVKTSFTQSTLELVVKDATREAARDHVRFWAWPLRVACLLLIPLVSLVLVANVTDIFQNARHRELVQQLPLIENLFYYETAENFDFLVSLKKSEQFSDNDPWQDVSNDQPEVETGVSLLQSNFKQREQILADFDLAQLDQLKRKKTRFENLSEQQLEKIQTFHEQLTRHPDGENLQKILVRYYIWLKSLDEVTRTEIMDLPTNQRKAQIRLIKINEAERLFGLVGSTAVPDEDKKFVLDWVNLIIDSNRERIQRLFVREYRNKIDAIRRGEIKVPGGQYIDRLMVLSPEVVGDLMFEDVQSLRWGLSPAGQKIFEGQNSEDQKKLLLQWLRSALDAQRLVTDEDLKKFYDNLPPDRKEELNNQDAESRRLILHRELLSERRSSRTTPSRPDFLDDF